MPRYKIENSELKELAEIYNRNGKKAVYEIIRARFSIKNPTHILRRMRENPDLSYNEEKDCFETEALQDDAESVFMSMEELCNPNVPRQINQNGQEEFDSRPAAMDKLIRELIGDRLLELNKYVRIDSLSKRIIIDKTTLTHDGYQLVTH